MWIENKLRMRIEYTLVNAFHVLFVAILLA